MVSFAIQEIETKEKTINWVNVPAKNSLYFYIGKVTVTVLNKYIFTKKWKTQQIFSPRDS